MFHTKRKNSVQVKTGNSMPVIGSSSYLFDIGLLVYFIFIIYLLLGMVSILFTTNPNLSDNRLKHTFQFTYPPSSAINCLDALLKHWYSILIVFSVNRIINRGLKSTFMKYLKLTWTCSLKVSILCCKGKRFNRLISGLFCWLCLINLILIVVTNPSLLNPGPNSEKSKHLSVVYQNVTGLIPFKELGKSNPALDTIKILELNSYLSFNKPSIVILNETWLTGSINDSEIISKDLYKIFREDRTKKTHPPDPNNPKKFKTSGGGVFIAVRNDLDIKSVKISYKCAAEIVAVTLTFKSGKKMVICTCYRVGTLGDTNYKEINSYLQKIRARSGLTNLIVVGDFNFPEVDWESNHSRNSIDQNFLDMFSNLGFAQLIDKPTHIAGNILDLVLTDNISAVGNVKVNSGWNICKSNHYPITFDIKLRADRKKFPKHEIYNFKRANWDKINDKLLEVNWEHILGNDNIESSWNKFKSVFFSIIDKHIPKIKISSANQPPWFDSETFQLCREKELYHARSKRPNSSPDDYAKFSECRRAFKRLTEQKMRDNILTDDDSSDLITKKFWSDVKSKTKSSRIPETVHLADVYRSDTKDQVNLFNEFFYEQFTKPSKYDIHINYNTGDSYAIDFSKSKIRKLLSEINVNKAMGPDGIHGKMLKNCSNSLAGPLSILFQISYYKSELPKDWKSANVVPVHKKGSKADIENYRPISLTSIVAKTLERIIRDEVMLRCSNHIDQRQHGFLIGKSCGTQLLSFCDSLAISLHECTRSDVIYFDFAKAFDSVNHDIILEKLKNQFNIDGYLLGFILNYLKDRTQSVVMSSFSSSCKPVTSGVPQGSILGPTLFVLFLNDITGEIDKNTNILMYADDTKIWREIKCEDDHHVLQCDINSLMDWAVRNCMKFHPSKCKALMVSRSKMPLLDILPFVQFHYSVGRNLIDYCEIEKDLGIHINGTLNFSQHSDVLYSKANQRFGLLKRTCHFIKSPDRRRALYLTMVRSIFEHCPYVWRPSSMTTIEKLESIQKRGLKWILSNHTVSFSANYHLYLVHCKQLNILPIKFRFDFNDLKMFHSIVYGYSCVKLPDYIQPFQGSRLRKCHLDSKCYVSTIQPPSSANNIKNGSVSKGILSKSFFYRVHLSWNNLPLSLREIIRPSEFKQKLLTHIWNKNIKDEYDKFMEGISDNPINFPFNSEYPYEHMVN